MNVKAEAYQEYNQAAVVDKLITNMPEIVRALAAPLANVDKITIVSTGNGDASGMNKITGDMTAMAAQIPALFETLSGMQMSELLSKVKSIGDKRREDRKRAAVGSASRRKGEIMALLERVSTFIRANLNDLVDQAEKPEKMIKQVILDMQNQLMQVKTQVAIAIADQHVLEKKHKETTETETDWMRKAEPAVGKKQDDLARAALERALSCQQMAAGFEQQVADQKIEVENLRPALHKLEQKLAEAEAKSDLLIAQHRRARALSRANDAGMAAGGIRKSATFDRMKTKCGMPKR